MLTGEQRSLSLEEIVKELKNEILEKQTELNKLISILNNENDTEFID